MGGGASGFDASDLIMTSSPLYFAPSSSRYILKSTVLPCAIWMLRKEKKRQEKQKKKKKTKELIFLVVTQKAREVSQKKLLMEFQIPRRLKWPVQDNLSDK